jgi:hypothetical protein
MRFEKSIQFVIIRLWHSAVSLVQMKVVCPSETSVTSDQRCTVSQPNGPQPKTFVVFFWSVNNYLFMERLVTEFEGILPSSLKTELNLEDFLF